MASKHKVRGNPRSNRTDIDIAIDQMELEQLRDYAEDVLAYTDDDDDMDLAASKKIRERIAALDRDRQPYHVRQPQIQSHP